MKLIAPTPYPEAEKTVARGAGGGKLKTIRGQKVLQLWGTPEERAYSHGYLVGPQIRDFFNYVVVEYFAQSVDQYQEVLQYVQGHFAGQTPYAAEADAMLQGMEDSGTNITVATLKGPGRCTDIWLDGESRQVAAAGQNEVHRAYEKAHGLPGWIAMHTPCHITSSGGAAGLRDGNKSSRPITVPASDRL